MEKCKMNVGDKVWVFQPNVRANGIVYHATWKETYVASVRDGVTKVNDGVVEWVDEDGYEIMLNLFLPEYGFMITKKKPDFSKESIMKIQEKWNNYNE